MNTSSATSFWRSIAVALRLPISTNKSERRQTAGQSIGNKKFILLSVLTVAGFTAAILVNLLFPQFASVKISHYPLLGGMELDINGAYRIVLIALILLYLGIASFSWLDPERRKKFQKRMPFRFVIGLVLALWDVFGTKLLLLPQPFFPGPARIIESFLMESGYIWQNTLYSLRLFLVGFILGVALGVGTGILIGWFHSIYYWVYPVLKITGVIPAVAWMPFALTLFPTPFAAATFLIIICAWFPVASLTASGIAGTPKVHFEVARTLGAKTPYLVFRVAIPHALPNIFTGISTANAFTFTTLVMAEMMGQPGGLGYYINASKVWSAYYKVFAAILVMAVLFSLIMYAIGLIQGRLLRWQKGLVKA
ncbi:NitT/TauT family transport system permease protein [Ruminiclostridium sufflavum DSM 19573]|uniref:NitT/TauT family transport system permease protein n=1 Tax=Ruminiclostridium sufflavum DSM 19573 TaxID=1121337 RepID=A0A318Y8K3_9FIRM|nr:ABC transporter permease [Ruminiclostridium sufflavum]PYG88544.1 NitT/TauT family transport system permease protein [Ruminiclostridium sufflavum DSM 19573]